MSIFRNHLPIMGASGAQSTGYTIDQSIRFNKDDSAYMQRTNSSGGNTDLFTISFWLKRCRLTLQSQNDEMMIFGGGNDGNNTFDIMFSKQDELIVWDYQSGYLARLITTQKFRDVSAWFHIVFVYDSGNAIPVERARLYINGERVTNFSTHVVPSQNQDSIIGTNSRIGFGRYISYQSGKHLDAYLADAHYVNGYGYGPEYFGEFDDNNIWIPKEYTGSYGTGGFFVDGRDSSDLGDDESGNGNDLTTSGLAADDQRADSPTNNYHTWASTHGYVDGGTQTFANGNLDASVAAASWGSVVSTMGIPDSGKWTFAFKLTAALGGSSYPMIGVIDSLNQPVQDAIGLHYQSPTPANSMIYVNTYENASNAGVFKGGADGNSTLVSSFAHGGATNGEWQWFINSDDKEFTLYHNGTKRVDAIDISFLTFPIFVGAALYAYNGLRFLNEPGTEYTPSLAGYSAVNSVNIGAI